MGHLWDTLLALYPQCFGPEQWVLQMGGQGENPAICMGRALKGGRKSNAACPDFMADHKLV